MNSLKFLIVAALLTVAPSAKADNCASDSVAQMSYVVCIIDADRDDLRLFWKGDDGLPLRHFGALANALAVQKEHLAFAMNAGMYLPDYTPSGLYVEDGKEMRPLITSGINAEPSKVPNFYKKPNGVFYIGRDGTGVMTTEAFDDVRPDVSFATQSGPMLVIDGDIHPAFIPNSTQRTRRTGIGVCDDGQIRLAISDGGVNFYEFAQLFRDEFECRNALFLDGGRGTGLYDPAIGRRDFSWHGGFGPMIGVVVPEDR